MGDEPTIGQTAPETVAMMCLGGRRHGDLVAVTVRAGVPASWTDLATATTYYARPFSYLKKHPDNPRSVSLATSYRQVCLVHESIVGDENTARAHWADVGIRLMVEEYGTVVSAPDTLNQASEQSANGNGHPNPGLTT